MRRFAAVQTCLTLLLAFLLAPFQHVHTGRGSGPEHDHAGLIHAHFYMHFESVPASGAERHSQEIDDADDDHAAAWSLDTFTLVLTAGLSPFVLPQEPAPDFVPSETFQPVALVEERGHSPPPLDRSIPRAPPS
jgi:hypothetical protein